MKRHKSVKHSGKCPSCGDIQLSYKQEDVNKLCWPCERHPKRWCNIFSWGDRCKEK